MIVTGTIQFVAGVLFGVILEWLTRNQPRQISRPPLASAWAFGAFIMLMAVIYLIARGIGLNLTGQQDTTTDINTIWQGLLHWFLFVFGASVAVLVAEVRLLRAKR